MDDVNPYASPPIIAEQVLPHFGDGTGLWRQGNLLVIRKGVALPPRCVKSNLPAERFLKRNLTWHPLWVFALILLHVVIYVIVALIIRKNAKIEIGLTQQWYTRRWRHIITAWSIAAFAVLLFVGGGLVFKESPTAGLLMIIASPLTLFATALYGIVAARLVYPKKIDDHFIWLKGVCREYLAELPEWTGPLA